MTIDNLQSKGCLICTEGECGAQAVAKLDALYAKTLNMLKV